MNIFKSALLCAALVLPLSAFAQSTLTAEDNKDIEKMCTGFALISKGIMQARQEGETKENVRAQLQDVISQKASGGMSSFLTTSTQVLLDEAYTVPVSNDPERAKNLSLAFGVATYTKCMDRFPTIIEEHRAKKAAK